MCEAETSTAAHTGKFHFLVATWAGKEGGVTGIWCGIETSGSLLSRIGMASATD